MDKSNISFTKSFWCDDKACPGHLWKPGHQHFHFELNRKPFAGVIVGDVSTFTNTIQVCPTPDKGRHWTCGLPIPACSDKLDYWMGKFLKRHRKEILAC
jgi:hypothetical protein